MQDIRTVFNILGKNNIKVSVFTVNLQTLDFLGYNISADGVKPTKKINNLQSFPTPSDVEKFTQLFRNDKFYSKLIPQFADLVLPLTKKNNFTKGSIKLNKIKSEAFNICYQNPY